MQRYWQENHFYIVEKAKSFDELARVAIDIAGLMPQPLGQICGPYSTGGKGSIEANAKEFKRAVDLFDERGLHVFDQTPFETSFRHLLKDWQGGYPTMILSDFYAPLFESGYIKKAYFLPDWKSSYGALWEHDHLEKLDIEIVELPTDWDVFNWNNI